jgi:hypothetical protein
LVGHTNERFGGDHAALLAVVRELVKIAGFANLDFVCPTGEREQQSGEEGDQ